MEQALGRMAELAESHPAWGAWIEMPLTMYFSALALVAPRMGCVDRNLWHWCYCWWCYDVAPRMGCVDRNNVTMLRSGGAICRTPHGVRGSKSLCPQGQRTPIGGRTPHGVRGSKSLSCCVGRGGAIVAPRMGCVDRNSCALVTYLQQ